MDVLGGNPIFVQESISMQTIQTNNPETESFLSITKEEAMLKIIQAIKEVKNGTAKLLSQNEYDEDMNEFMKTL